jgi:hypothetical protein
MPSEYDIAVETFVNPIDLPLLSEKKKYVFGLMDGLLLWFSGYSNFLTNL